VKKIVEMFTDGACRGNPGPGGWGVLLRYDKKEKNLYGGAEQTTNNRMELTAVIEGLKALKNSTTVKITTDSRYVKDGMTLWIHSWKKNDWASSKKRKIKNIDLWRQLDQAVEQHQVEWHWVRGHSGHPENEIADALANRGVDEVVDKQ